MTRKKILFFTNCDFGQANVILATAHALVQTSPDLIEVHIASFHKLGRTVHDTSTFALKTLASKHPDEPTKTATPFTFHGISGRIYFEACFDSKTGIEPLLHLRPGLINTGKLVSRLPTALMPWAPEELVSIY